MDFQLPEYIAPDFSAPAFLHAPDVKTAIAEMDGVAPEGYHSTSMYPEYFKIDGKWTLATQSRMDASVVIRPDGDLSVLENRNLKKGDRVIRNGVNDDLGWSRVVFEGKNVYCVTRYLEVLG